MKYTCTRSPFYAFPNTKFRTFREHFQSSLAGDSMTVRIETVTTLIVTRPLSAPVTLSDVTRRRKRVARKGQERWPLRVRRKMV